jgi:hypothetical protein
MVYKGLKIEYSRENCVQAVIGVVMVKTPTSNQDRLIDQTLSLLKNAMAETKTVLPAVQFRRPAEPKDVVASEPPVQELRTGSLISHALSLVENVAVAESTAVEVESSSLQQPVAKQTASLIDRNPSMVETVAVADAKPFEVAPPSSQQPLLKQPTSKERLDMERADIQKRIATFKANQQRFQREREEYYATTMAKARATQWTPPGNPNQLVSVQNGSMPGSEPSIQLRTD